MRHQQNAAIAFASPIAATNRPSRAALTSTFRSPLLCSRPRTAQPKHATMMTDVQASDSFTSTTAVESDSSESPSCRTLVCTSLTAPTLLEQLAQSRQAADAGADIVEIRVDLLDPKEQAEYHRLLPALNLPAIITNRASWEGGKSPLAEPERLGILLDAVRRGVSHIDVELKAVEAFITLCKEKGETFPLRGDTRLIVSNHDFDNPIPAAEIEKIISKVRSIDPHAVAKIAMASSSAMDNITAFTILKQYSTPSQPVVVIAMGELGQPSRIAAAKFGAYLTFASLSSASESAPGQVDLRMLLDVYRFRAITPSTSLYAVLGDPVRQSMSPALHNAALSKRGIAAAYLPARVEAASYAPFVRAAVDLGFAGMSVTIPGKLPVMDAMDEMDAVAERIGAMNTVVSTRAPDGSMHLKGYNTDWVAAMAAIEEAVPDGSGLSAKRVVVLGAGGAGRALAFGALARGASSVLVVNRSLDKARALADDLASEGEASGMSLEQFNRGEVDVQFDVLMNSTSVGMYPKEDESPVVGDRICQRAVVFDAIYNPLKTRLLKEAELRQCVTVSGVEMFVRQAAEQFQLWFPDVEPPVDVMREVVMEKLRSR